MNVLERAAGRLLNPPPMSEPDRIVAEADAQIAHGLACETCGMASRVAAVIGQVRRSPIPPGPSSVDEAAKELVPLLAVADDVAERRRAFGCVVAEPRAVS